MLIGWEMTVGKYYDSLLSELNQDVLISPENFIISVKTLQFLICKTLES